MEGFDWNRPARESSKEPDTPDTPAWVRAGPAPPTLFFSQHGMQPLNAYPALPSERAEDYSRAVSALTRTQLNHSVPENSALRDAVLTRDLEVLERELDIRRQPGLEAKEARAGAGAAAPAMAAPTKPLKPFRCPVRGCNHETEHWYDYWHHKNTAHARQCLRENEDGTFTVVDEYNVEVDGNLTVQDPGVKRARAESDGGEENHGRNKRVHTEQPQQHHSPADGVEMVSETSGDETEGFTGDPLRFLQDYQFDQVRYAIRMGPHRTDEILSKVVETLEIQKPGYAQLAKQHAAEFRRRLVRGANRIPLPLPAEGMATGIDRQQGLTNNKNRYQTEAEREELLKATGFANVMRSTVSPSTENGSYHPSNSHANIRHRAPSRGFNNPPSEELWAEQYQGRTRVPPYTRRQEPQGVPEPGFGVPSTGQFFPQSDPADQESIWNQYTLRKVSRQNIEHQPSQLLMLAPSALVPSQTVPITRNFLIEGRSVNVPIISTNAPGVKNRRKCGPCSRSKRGEDCNGPIPICDECRAKGYDEEICTSEMKIADIRAERALSGLVSDGN